MYHITQDPNELDYTILVEIEGIVYHEFDDMWQPTLSEVMDAIHKNLGVMHPKHIEYWLRYTIYSGDTLPTIYTHPELFL